MQKNYKRKEKKLLKDLKMKYFELNMVISIANLRTIVRMILR